MANSLNVALVESIRSLFAQGWSRRRIARELGVDRETVGKYVSQELDGQNPPNLPTGSRTSKPATFPGLPGPEPADRHSSSPAGTPAPKPARNLPTGSPHPAGPASKCEPLRELILSKVEQGLSARRIHQDLGGETSGIGYDSVRRFIQRLGCSRPLPFRRLECAAGEEAQVDFGTGAPVLKPDGKRRKTHVFRIVLSHSRKAYSEATFTQTTDDFLRALENAFAHFGGVPRTLVIDNLKAAVAHPDWFDPELTPKVQSFCQHYGTVILPTRPYMPRHKGKVESGVKYVQNNALQGRKFSTLEEQQRHLAHWEQTIADTRIHGTTKRQVLKVFQEERPALLPLPRERFANFHEARRKVNRDGHVEVAKAYYSAPPEYLGREVWVRWDARLVRIFNGRFEQIAIHVRQPDPGKRLRNGPFARLLPLAIDPPVAAAPSGQTAAAAVPRRASADPAAGRLWPTRRAGDPSPGGSPLRGRRFWKAWPDKSMPSLSANREPGGTRATRPSSRKHSGLASARIGISLARLLLSRAWLRFSRRLYRSSPFLV
jgi:transposase